jgi:hypothetical protein
MTASYGPASAQHRALQEWARQSQLLEPIAEMVSRLVVLRRPLALVAMECDDLAFWSPRSGAIVFCYRYFDFVLRLVPREDFKPVVLFTLLHEVAHALTAELSLPIVGREEDAADRFAATVMLANVTEGEILLPAARFFRKLSTERTPSMWDEHLTDGQRFSDLVCLAWGSSPARAGAYGALLPVDRRERCDNEYEQARSGWHRLLKPYSRVRGGQTFWPD